jgi:hypothetical protein
VHVLNEHAAGRHDAAIYIGRGSKWGNPFRIGVDGYRAAVIAGMPAGCGISVTCCARSTSFEARICSVLRAGAMSWRSAAAARQRTREERVLWWRSAA